MQCGLTIAWLQMIASASNLHRLSVITIRLSMYISVNPDLILTYNSHKGLILSIKIRHQYLGGYNLTETGCVLLPDEISELISYMCGPLNRKDYLCGECKSGYGPGPFVTSCTNVCHLCQDTWHEIIILYCI